MKKPPSFATNQCRKTRDIDNPYEIWKSHDSVWDFRVLRKNKADINPTCLWHCAVRSSDSAGSWEYSDLSPYYIKEIAVRLYIDPEIDYFRGVRPALVGKPFTIPDPAQPMTFLSPAIFPYLNEYFAINGMSLHMPNVQGNAMFFVTMDSRECQGTLDAQWGVSYEMQSPDCLQLQIEIFDKPGDSLMVPFTFHGRDMALGYDMVRLVEQDKLHFFVLTRKDGDLYFFDLRIVSLPEKFKVELAPVIKDLLLASKNVR